MFSDSIRPQLATLGEKLERADLDTGLKKDQKLHMKIAEEYNKKGIFEYDNNAFPNLKKGRLLPPSQFQPIDWHKSKDVLGHMRREYDQCFSN